MRRHGDGLGGGGVPAELRAAVASSWATTVACSRLGQSSSDVLHGGRVRFEGVAGDLHFPSRGAHVP
jgi:hypothetical protein